MVFGGRKFEKWKKENPSGIFEIFRVAQGSSMEMERILNQATNNECQKQIKKFIKESKELGILSKF